MGVIAVWGVLVNIVGRPIISVIGDMCISVVRDMCIGIVGAVCISMAMATHAGVTKVPCTSCILWTEDFGFTIRASTVGFGIAGVFIYGVIIKSILVSGISSFQTISSLIFQNARLPSHEHSFPT